MGLSPGTRVGRYEVMALLGVGGMGEVYRARDTVLNRDVALKVLPTHFILEPERLARFTREAQVLASLSHVHIAGVYGLEEGGSGAGPALAMELVEGPILSERIAQGPVPVDEALSIARQIAEALEAAHERGIIHRDLKPANIKLRSDGSVKVLDFGLAKLAEGPAHPAANRADVSASPTMVSPAMVTGAGVILGTAAYMSPEQARGKEVDRRADIWAFGVVLYEMITGKRPFEGDAVTEVAGAVIHKEPNWQPVDAKAPAHVGAVLRRCLEKDPKKRIRDIGDVLLALEGAFETPSSAPTGSGRGGRRIVALLAIAAIGALIAGAAVWWFTRPQPAGGSSVRFIVPPPPQSQLGQFLVMSPDGASLAFFATEAGAQRLWVHSFATGETRLLARAGVVSGAPFWSPDSRFIGYTDGNAQLSKIDPSGGPPEVITTITTGFAGGSWGDGNVILFAAPTQGIMQISSNGGTPTALTKLDAARKETSHTGPWFLPGGRRFLYLRSSSDAAHAGVYVGELDTPPEKQNLRRVIATEQNALYASSSTKAGQLLFMRDRTLFAQTFDPGTLMLSGESRRIADEIGTGAGNTVSYGYFTTSNTGAIAYRRGQSTAGSVVWVSRTGQEAGTITPQLERVANPRLSPDGQRLAVTVLSDLWVYDVGGRPPIKLTSGGSSFSPLWSPDGRRLAFELGTLAVELPSDGSSLTPQPMSPGEGHFHPFGWSRDGSELILVALPGPTKTFDILRYSIAKQAAEPFLATPDQEGAAGASLSPDGRWLAYVTNQTGRPEVWVRAYPSGGAPVRISPNGGFEPTWSRDGRELFYREQTRLMVVPVNLSGGFNFKPASLLFESRFLHSSQPPTYDVAADGRFVMIKPADASVAPFNVILNWAARQP